MEAPSPATNMVRQRRVARGWSQADLARRAGISRAAVSAIEIARLVPSVSAALAIARVFGCSVESLFGSGTTGASAPDWAWPPREVPCRYRVAEVRGRILRYPVETASAATSRHDGVFRSGAFFELVRAEPASTLVLASCDPAAGLLVSEYAQSCGFRMIVVARSSRQSLDLLARGLVHVAGIHFATDAASAGNERAVRDAVGSGHRLLRVADWEEGLVVADRTRVRSVREALRADFRWVGREVGSAARECLDELRPRARPPRRYAFDHRGVAEAVRCGWADAGVCHRFAAVEAGLRVFTVRRERYDFCYPAKADGDPRIEALVRLIRSPQHRQLLADLPGYDARSAGESRVVH
jgi:molybdate-binding protein/transcriptional regulator with XRE-family HTH domain